MEEKRKEGKERKRETERETETDRERTIVFFLALS